MIKLFQDTGMSTTFVKRVERGHQRSTIEESVLGISIDVYKTMFKRFIKGTITVEVHPINHTVSTVIG